MSAPQVSSRRDVLRSELALLGVVLIWGVNFTVMKVGVERLDPLLFNAARFTLSVVLLGALHARDARRLGTPWLPPRAMVPVVLGLGLVGHAGYQAGFVLGLARTTSGTSSLLIASAPLWTALLAHATGIERLGSRAWFGLLLAIAGTGAVAAGTGLEFGPEVLTGNLITIGAAVCWGVYTAWSRPVLKRASSLALAFWSMGAAMPFLWLMAWPAAMRLEPGVVDGSLIAAGVYAGLLGTGVAYVLWNTGVRHVGPARTATAACLVPVLALLFGSQILGEPLEGVQIAGGSVVLIGIATMGRARAGTAQPPAVQPPAAQPPTGRAAR